MSITKHYGFEPATQETISGFLPYFLNPETVVRDDQLSVPGYEVLKSLDSVMGYPEYFGTGSSVIKDMYKNYKDIVTGLKPISTSGLQIMFKNWGFYRFESTDDPTYELKIPYATWTVHQTILNPFITEDDVLALLRRHAGQFFNSTTATSGRIGKVLRGNLNYLR